MAEITVIRTLDAGNETFQRLFKKLPNDVLKQAKSALGELLCVDVASAPAKLHLHTLKDKLVPSVKDPKKKVKVYTFHLTRDDTYKASFTLEDGVAYLRVCGEHDSVDKSP
ncbi:hypothetical protein RPSD_15950 [Ralstonia solanacearum]|nr:hypothetical protein RPSD_15950 [Ralstonia solanacearum]